MLTDFGKPDEKKPEVEKYWPLRPLRSENLSSLSLKLKNTKNGYILRYEKIAKNLNDFFSQENSPWWIFGEGPGKWHTYSLLDGLQILTECLGNRGTLDLQLPWWQWPSGRLVGDLVVKAIKHNERSTAGPILVHCTAGISKTGTFIGLAKLWQDLQNPDCRELEVVIWCVGLWLVRCPNLGNSQSRDFF